MENVILIIHLILALGIIGLVLIQRSEGGGLGIGGGGGGGGGMGGFATPKGAASMLTKMTAFFAACFFMTSLTLAILAGTHSNNEGILATYSAEAEQTSEGRAQLNSIDEETNETAVDSGEENNSGPSNDSEESDIVEPAPKPSVPIGE